MPSPESLLRLRPAFYRLFVAATAAAGVIVLASIVAGELTDVASKALGTVAVVAVASICALIGIAYTRRRERTGPALIGLVLTSLTSVGVLASIWITLYEDLFLFWVMISVAWTVAWAFILAIFTERLAAPLVLVQRVTALAMVAMAAGITITILTGPESEQAESWTAVFAVVGFAGMLIVIALAHLYRSGVRSLVPMAHVLSVPRAMDFYRKLGFQCENSFAAKEGAEPVWAWMETPGGAQLMLVCAEEPLVAAQQGVLFYIYCDDLPAKHAELMAKGIAVGPIETPFYAPRGEFRATDPDGYALMLTHT